MQIQITFKYHFISNCIIKINVWTVASFGEDVKKIIHYMFTGRTVKWCIFDKSLAALHSVKKNTGLVSIYTRRCTLQSTENIFPLLLLFVEGEKKSLFHSAEFGKQPYLPHTLHLPSFFFFF